MSEMSTEVTSEPMTASTSTASTRESQGSSSDGGKVKQTRRRQRLSCVECTKRRQKCDRQFPCGLCTTRGIPHLCRWEPIVVRPTPQRPPVIPSSAENATVEALSARIAALEQALLTKHNQLYATCQTTAGQLNTSPTLSSTASSKASSRAAKSNSPDGERAVLRKDMDFMKATAEGGPRALLDFKVQLAAVALAQLSLAPSAEYVGSGTVLCALHKLGDPEQFRFPITSSLIVSPATSSVSFARPGLDGTAHPLTSPIRELLFRLPPRHHLDALLRAFFTERNWLFGISERWFRAAVQKMWSHLDLSCSHPPEDSCQACKEDVNPHWLCLLFSVLALAPVSGHAVKDSATYFLSSLAARRLVDDILLVSPMYSFSENAVHGGVLSCLAAVFQARYLADRSRVSEAWKLIGTALRSAQSFGLHRDPEWRKWKEMQRSEIELRVITWWLLIVSDRTYSLTLGRPCMACRASYDVSTLPTEMYADGSVNEHAPFLHAYISLSGIVSEAQEKCLGVCAPPYALILEMDKRFQDWEIDLPPKLRWRKQSTPGSPAQFDRLAPTDFTDGTPSAERKYLRQRNMLAGLYLTGLMNLHRPYLMQPPPVLPPPGASPSSCRFVLNPSRERCIENAMELTRVMTTYYDEAFAWPHPGPMDAGTLAYFIFDGAVALAGALSQVPPHPQSAECMELIDKAMRVLGELEEVAAGAGDGQGELARRAIVVLKTLRRAGGWDMSDEEKGDLVLMEDMLRQQLPQFYSQSTNGSATHLNGQGGVDFGMSASFGHSGMHDSPPPRGGPSGPPYGAMSYSHTHGFPTSNGLSFVSSNSAGGSGQMHTSSSPSYPPMPFFPNQDVSYPGFHPSVSPHTQPSGMPAASPSSVRLSQPVVMPFDVLKGVQPNVQQETAEFDLDWARLAGMESWYSQGANNAMDASGMH